ncbi:MAG: hypothetical protein HY673_00470 [Chloroflexi bacterium]|nr:hypothetical protein [Chloroflexota bacterium]
MFLPLSVTPGRQRLLLTALIAAGATISLLPYWYSVGQLAAESAAAAAPTPGAPSAWYEQLALVSAVLIIKPIYTLLSAVLIVALIPFKSADAAALRWGLISFFIGEGSCAVNILFFGDASYLLEYLHMFGMAVSLGFVAYAAMEAADSRLVNFSNPEKKCAALSLCRRCAKYVDAPCALKRLFYFIIPVFVALAFIPLLATPRAASYSVDILGTVYSYAHPVAYQVFELRYSPVYAILLLAASLLVLIATRGKRTGLSKVLFAAGMGPLGFSFLRLIFVSTYRDSLVWLTFWEELTELVYISGIAFALWAFYRGALPWTKGRDNAA